MNLRYTDLALSAICITSMVIILTFAKWERSSIKWDPAGYYLPLPAIFVYQDFQSFCFYKKTIDQYQIHGAAAHCTPLANGNCVMKYSLGNAIIYSPGFFLGSLLVKFTQHPPDGYSPPYILGLSIWLWIFNVFGFFILSKVLLVHFDDLTTCLVLATLFFCSNLLVYTTYNSFMSHGILFTMYSIFLYTLQQIEHKPKTKWYWIFGLCTGLMVLIRPTEFMALLLFIPLYTFKLNWKAPWLNYKIIYALLGAVIIGSIQMVYWYWITGKPIFYTYGDQGFDFLRARIAEGMWGWKKGWLVYTPSMILALAGLLYAIWTRQKWSLRWLIFVYVMIHVTFSWSELFYGGSLGCRAVVQYYAVLAIPMGLMIQKLLEFKIGHLTLMSFLCFCLYQNVVITYHAHYPGGIWNANYMAKPIYQKILKNGFNGDREWFKYLDNPYDIHEENIKDQHQIFNEDITTIGTNLLGDTTILDGWILDTNHLKSKVLDIPFPREFAQLKEQPKLWCKITTGLWMERVTWEESKMTNLIVQWTNHGKIISSQNIRLERLLTANTLKEVTFDIPTDTGGNGLRIYAKNNGANHPIIVRYLKVVLIEEF